MKREVISILKERGKSDYFTQDKYDLVYQTMKHGMTKDKWLKNYLGLDPYNKSLWIADHLITLTDQNLI